MGRLARMMRIEEGDGSIDDEEMMESEPENEPNPEHVAARAIVSRRERRQMQNQAPSEVSQAMQIYNSRNQMTQLVENERAEGLSNGFGNNFCYLNSVIQQLYNLPCVRDPFLNGAAMNHLQANNEEQLLQHGGACS